MANLASAPLPTGLIYSTLRQSFSSSGVAHTISAAAPPGEAEQLPRPCRARCTPDRTLDEDAAGLRNGPGERLLSRWANSAHLDEVFSARTLNQSVLTAINFFLRSFIEQGRDDDIATLREETGVVRHRQPVASAFADNRFQTINSSPTSRSRAAMAEPTLPIPAIPMRMVLP